MKDYFDGVGLESGNYWVTVIPLKLRLKIHCAPKYQSACTPTLRERGWGLLRGITKIEEGEGGAEGGEGVVVEGVKAVGKKMDFLELDGAPQVLLKDALQHCLAHCQPEEENPP